MISTAIVFSTYILRQIASKCPQQVKAVSSLSSDLIARYKWGIGNNYRNYENVPVVQAIQAAPFYSKQKLMAEVDYREVKKIIKRKDKYLIDVRNKYEVKHTGKIPSAIHIPLEDIKQALRLHPLKFLKRYGRQKPSKQSSITVYCNSGNRSCQAAALIEKLGYHRIYNYAGSWNDWAEHEGISRFKPRK